MLSIITLDFYLWFNRFNSIWHCNCTILFVLPCTILLTVIFFRWFSLFEYWNCFGLVLFFPHLKCLIPNFPLSLSGCCTLMAHGVTMPLFLSQTLTCLQTLEFFQRKPKPRRKILSKSPARGQGPYPRPTGVNGVFPLNAVEAGFCLCISVTFVRFLCRNDASVLKIIVF